MLKSDLQAKVRNAFNELENNVQQMYDAQKKAELKNVQKCLEVQIPIIQGIIDQDAKTGRKGLMSRLGRFALLHHSGTDLRAYSSKVNNFFTNFFNELSDQSDVSTLTNSLPSRQLSRLYLKKCLTNFHRDVSDKIDALKKALDNFTPTKFADASPLLNVIKRGVTDLHEELRKQYVSRYSGVQFAGQLVKPKENSDTIPVKAPKQTDDNNELNDEGRKAAKVCVTILPSVYDHLSKLKEDCEHGWKQNKICLISGRNEHNNLGHFLKNCGYEVTIKEDSHDGELKFPSTGYKGEKIYDKLNDTISEANRNLHLATCRPNKKRKDFNVLDILKCVHHLR
ncbi:hypothetical protein, conserved [Babesia ovata]|uniref:Uncharacterized protein n=1 Tax=Babesia ovata TaxID=189622 RepID=A0A2H6KKD5_9APIC|nr:uncharacterized protein BOVATA_049490 [Babesia ovata]GBE63456.1 hypothetical protein, conserved [Babesia ovata]